MSRHTAEETPPDLATPNRSPVVTSLAGRRGTMHALPPRAREFAKVGEASLRNHRVEGDGSLDAARGMALGGVVGGLWWLLVGSGVYLILRWGAA